MVKGESMRGREEEKGSFEVVTEECNGGNGKDVPLKNSQALWTWFLDKP